MTCTLYVTYDGLLDPLGQSQVLPYALRLGEMGVRLAVLSYEKPAQWQRQAYANVRQLLASRGIVWYALTYHKSPALLAKSYDIVRGVLLATLLTATRRVTIVHARSYAASVIALVAKWLTGCRFLFDMRGLWADERVDGHWWRPGSLLFRIAKRFEALFLSHADHVVVLTTGLKALLPEFSAMKRRPARPISVIPTCVDLNRFHGRRSPGSLEPSASSPNQFVYVYLGSVGPLYLLNEVARFFRVALERNLRAFLSVLTNGSEHDVQAMLAERGVPRDRYQILDVSHEDVPRYLADARVSVFFTKPCYSRVAKYPTKFGESLASGLPVVTNRGAVDIDMLLEQHRIGIVLDELTQEAYRSALERLETLMRDPGLSARCRQVAINYLSLDEGVCAYRRIYDTLSSETSVRVAGRT